MITSHTESKGTGQKKNPRVQWNLTKDIVTPQSNLVFSIQDHRTMQTFIATNIARFLEIIQLYRRSI
jgi:hypothetical protein